MKIMLFIWSWNNLEKVCKDRCWIFKLKHFLLYISKYNSPHVTDHSGPHNWPVFTCQFLELGLFLLYVTLPSHTHKISDIHILIPILMLGISKAVDAYPHSFFRCQFLEYTTPLNWLVSVDCWTVTWGLLYFSHFLLCYWIIPLLSSIYLIFHIILWYASHS